MTTANYSAAVAELMADDHTMIELEDTIADACSNHYENFLQMLRHGHWTLAHAHDVLAGGNIDLMQIAGLARAMQVCQSQPSHWKG